MRKLLSLPKFLTQPRPKKRGFLLPKNMSLIEENVVTKIRERAAHGEQKYGLTMERSDLHLKNWLIHAQEEAMDLAVYLQKIIEMLEETHEQIRK